MSTVAYRRPRFMALRSWELQSWPQVEVCMTRAIFGVMACVWAVTALFAQDPYGRITGRVMDSAGAVVPGVSVRVKNTESNVETDVNSDSQGNYEARNLVPGLYQVAAETRGFKRYLRGPIEVRVGDVLTV